MEYNSRRPIRVPFISSTRTIHLFTCIQAHLLFPFSCGVVECNSRRSYSRKHTHHTHDIYFLTLQLGAVECNSRRLYSRKHTHHTHDIYLLPFSWGAVECNSRRPIRVPFIISGLPTPGVRSASPIAAKLH